MFVPLFRKTTALESILEQRKARYRVVCDQFSVPLHLQAWWLDAVCGTHGWQAGLVSDGSGRVLGIWPYMPDTRWGLPILRMPPFTSYAGPYLFYPQQEGQKVYKRHEFEHKVMNSLIGQLPRTVYFYQNFLPGVRNSLPFQWAGYQQTTRYTYVVPAKTKVPELNHQLGSELRRRVNKAAEDYEVQLVFMPELLWEMYLETCIRRGIKPGGERNALLRLCKALQERDQADIFVAFERKNGEPVAALLLAHQGTQSQHILGGQVSGSRTGYLNYLMLYQALRYAVEHQRSFDFEGSMNKGVSRVFRAFGGQLLPYHALRKFF
jgi:hypothetical protein